MSHTMIAMSAYICTSHTEAEGHRSQQAQRRTSLKVALPVVIEEEKNFEEERKRIEVIGE